MNANTKKTGIENTRPAFSLYHPNAKGTGCMMRLELHPAEVGADGYVLMTLTPQIANPRQTPRPTFPLYDFENKISARLGFNEITKILQVLRGECESIDCDHGMYLRTTAGSTRIQLRHLFDPVTGYSLEVYNCPSDGGDETRVHFLMSSAEALGVCEAFVGCMYLVTFGIPASLIEKI